MTATALPPDPRALALAGELQDRLPGAQVLLFGSRATGAWTPERMRHAQAWARQPAEGGDDG